MTPTATATNTVHALAAFYAGDAAELRREAEARDADIKRHREAAYLAERARDEAAQKAREAEAQVTDLARALAWNGAGIVHQTRADGYRPWDDSEHYAAAFARGRVTSSPAQRGRAPMGRAYGWVHDRDGSTSGTDVYVPSSGTNDPEKLRAQRVAATEALLAWLADYTAEAWLTRNGIDPATAPPLVAVVAVGVDTLRRGGWGYDAYSWPRWTLTLGGVEIARLEDTTRLLRPDEADYRRDPGPTLYEKARTILGEITGGDDGVRTYAVRHAERARDAMVRSFEPDRTVG